MSKERVDKFLCNKVMQNYRFYKMQQPNFEKIHVNVVSFLCHTLLDQHLVYIPLANKQMKLIKEKIQA